MGRRRDYYERDLVKELGARFAANARVRRLRLRQSQETVAFFMKEIYGFPWHQTMVAKIEAGERAVKMDEAFALCRILGIEMDDLLRGRNMDVIRNGTPVVTRSGVHVSASSSGDPDAPFQRVDSLIEAGLAVLDERAKEGRG